jgi:perosamine synthetase
MRIDIAWRDIAYGLCQCFALRRRAPVAAPDRAMVCLSVRTGFDLLLQSLRFPAGSEVIMTAVSIADMFQIVRENGLIPIPLDFDLATLNPTAADLKKLLTSRTRAVVIAPLFGVQAQLEPILAVAKEHGLFMIEDHAQAFSHAGDLGHPDADANLLSFGPIKTATALGGALVRVRDPRILEAMRVRQSQYPLQKRRQYAGRLLKYAGLKLLSSRVQFGLLLFVLKALGRDPDQVFRALTRNFGKRELLERIRSQPCQALTSMVLRRWRNASSTRVELRTQLGASMERALDKVISVPGVRATEHSHWVFPVISHDPRSLVTLLQANGFDATQSHNLTVLQAGLAAMPRPVSAMTQNLSQVVFLPCYPELTDAAVQRMAQLVVAHAVTGNPKPDLIRKAS